MPPDGMAGAFGYETAKCPVSETIARQGLVPHLERIAETTAITADGFSCRHQIAHFTGRKTLTLPERLWQGLQ
jgi:hypothetical protein